MKIKPLLSFLFDVLHFKLKREHDLKVKSERHKIEQSDLFMMQTQNKNSRYLIL